MTVVCAVSAYIMSVGMAIVSPEIRGCTPLRHFTLTVQWLLSLTKLGVLTYDIDKNSRPGTDIPTFACLIANDDDYNSHLLPQPSGQ